MGHILQIERNPMKNNYIIILFIEGYTFRKEKWDKFLFFFPEMTGKPDENCSNFRFGWCNENTFLGSPFRKYNYISQYWCIFCFCILWVGWCNGQYNYSVIMRVATLMVCNS